MHTFIPHNNESHNWKTITFILVVMCLSGAVAYAVMMYPDFRKTSISMDSERLVDSKEQITINFSFPVIPESVMQKMEISPREDVEVSWEDKNRKLKISPKTFWKPETKYDIEISGAKNVLLLNFNDSVSFSTKPYPKISSSFPVNGGKDVETKFTLEDPLVFNFDAPLNGYAVKFEITPQKEPEFQLSEDKRTIKLILKDDLEWNTNYKIIVFSKFKPEPEENYKKIGEISFDTKIPPPPAERSKDHKTLLEEAILYTKPAILEGKYIDICLKYQNMVIFENGKALSAHMISSGKRGMETPEGNFQIHNKTPRAWSKKYALFMPYWMAFVPSGQMGIHELPEWPGGYKEGANHLGTPVSHGCVRLGVGDAKKVYEWAEIGTPVVIHY